MVGYVVRERFRAIHMSNPRLWPKRSFIAIGIPCRGPSNAQMRLLNASDVLSMMWLTPRSRRNAAFSSVLVVPITLTGTTQ